MINSRTNRRAIKKVKKPTKRQMKLQGKIAVDSHTSNFRKSVWVKTIDKTDGYRNVKYILKKCSEGGCDGNIVYDEIGFKFCDKCGFGALNIYYDDEDEFSIRPNSLYKKDNIKCRNEAWNNNTIHYYVYTNNNIMDGETEINKQATELINRYKRIYEFEKIIRMESRSAESI